MPPAHPALLVVLGGLPGVGKSTIARLCCTLWRAVLLRIDAIEQALREAGASEVGTAGYEVAQALALSNLGLGLPVVVDAVNPVAAAREAWSVVARQTGSSVLTVELVCADREEHRRRVESRTADIPGLVLPGWGAVLARTYEPWHAADLRLDTADVTPNAAVAAIESAVAESVSAVPLPRSSGTGR